MTSEWIVNELEGVNFGDLRLNKRINDLLEKASKQPQVSINKMFHTRKEVQACYRFFSNDLVDETKIIKPHLQNTFNRSSQHPVLLCLSDTTSLNYTTRKKLKDSGYISSNNAQGFFLHANIVVTPDRLHLGIGSQKIWAREKEKPVIWCLLTSLSIDSLKDVMKVVECYLCRWEIMESWLCCSNTK